MSRRFLHILVFCTGSAITAIEITASRALAPYFGTSLFVWANVIGIVLFALALGYAAGGKIADRAPRPDVLLTIVLAAGLYSALIPLFVFAVTRLVTGSVIVLAGNLTLIIASFAASIALFFPPVFLLAMASPFALRLAEPATTQSGRVAGSLYAVSTVGSILGVFLPSFVLIPFVGVKETFLLASAVLLLVAGIGYPARRRWALVSLVVPLLVYGFGVARNDMVWRGSPLLEERDSVYQHLRVTEEEEGTVLRINDGIGYQSIYNQDRILTGSYFDYYTLLPYLLSERKHLDILIIGLAGGTISRQYDLLLGSTFSLDIDGVEIDPEVVELGRTHFDLDRSPLTIHVADGRTFLNATTKRYDIIIVDAYSQQVYIPPHLTTSEFFRLTRDHLRNDGIMAMNVNAFRDDAELLERVALTLDSVYTNVRMQRLPGLVNVLLVASDAAIATERLADRVPSGLFDLALAVREARAPAFAFQEEKLLTDNRAPIELLTESMFFDLMFQLKHG